MKVVFKQRVIDKIMDRIHEGEKNRQKVDYILVTEAEYSELRNEVGYHTLTPRWMEYYNTDTRATESTLRTIELDDPAKVRGYGHRPTMRFASHCVLFGHDLYVVPERFIK